MSSFAAKLNRRLYAVIASRTFLYWALGVFGLLSAWVAFASLYPMAFDEDTHVGLIKAYSQVWFPALPNNPALARFGAVPADPSYLFHYLMSFPWRLFQNVLHLPETASIILLRLLGIGMFIASLALFAHGLKQLKVSAFARHTIIALTCLLPISPLIAGQVNYDNLFMLLIAASFLLTINLVKALRKKQISLGQIAWFAAILLLGTATKYAFLPIAVGLVVVIGIVFLRTKSKVIIDKDKLLLTVSLIVLTVAALLNARYIINVVEYHAISPKCDQVFSQNDCMNYGVYARDVTNRTTMDDNFSPLNIVSYMTTHWIPGMFYRLFFTLAGPTLNYQTQDPAIVPPIVYGAVFITSAIAFIGTLPVLLRKRSPVFIATLAASLLYVLALVIQVYGDYRSTGQAVALNGRYLVPIFPLLGWMAIEALGEIRFRPKTYAPTIVTVCLFIIALCGGGIGTYLAAGNTEWFWPGFGQSTFHILHQIAIWFVPLSP